ncbi:MAG: hypothetical protein MJ115_01050 [Clostridia bacterium]|nr:hypothetical protein [Clostridia bacterium]
MTLGFIIKVIFEVLMVLLIVYGIFNEEKLIAFEDELYPVLKFCVHKYILKDYKPAHRKATLRVISGKKSVKTETKGVA